MTIGAWLFGCAIDPDRLNTLETESKFYLDEPLLVSEEKGILEVEWLFTLHSGEYSAVLSDDNGVFYECNGRCVSVLVPKARFNDGLYRGGLYIRNEGFTSERYSVFTVNQPVEGYDPEGAALAEKLFLKDLVESEFGKLIIHSNIEDEMVVSKLANFNL